MSVKARHLRKGMWLYYGGPQDMLIDEVSFTRDNEVRVACDYGSGDGLATCWFEANEDILVYYK